MREMRCSQRPPNVISYSAAISACEKGYKFEEMLSMLRDMLSIRVDPNVTSYNTCMWKGP